MLYKLCPPESAAFIGENKVHDEQHILLTLIGALPGRQMRGYCKHRHITQIHVLPDEMASGLLLQLLEEAKYRYCYPTVPPGEPGTGTRAPLLRFSLEDSPSQEVMNVWGSMIKIPK